MRAAVRFWLMSSDSEAVCTHVLQGVQRRFKGLLLIYKALATSGSFCMATAGQY